MTNPLRAKFQQLSLPAQPALAAAPVAPTGQDTALALLRAKLAGSQARVNPPEAKIADEALTPKLSTSLTPAVSAPVETSTATNGATRKRRTKAEMEAARVSSPIVGGLYPNLGDPHEATYAHADAVEPLVGASVDMLRAFSIEELAREIFRRIQL